MADKCIVYVSSQETQMLANWSANASYITNN